MDLRTLWDALSEEERRELIAIPDVFPLVAESSHWIYREWARQVEQAASLSFALPGSQFEGQEAAAHASDPPLLLFADESKDFAGGAWVAGHLQVGFPCTLRVSSQGTGTPQSQADQGMVSKTLLTAIQVLVAGHPQAMEVPR